MNLSADRAAATDQLAGIDELAIAPLLQLHEAHDDGLELVLGDGFLCRTILAYARIRNLATDLGVRFSNRQCPAVSGYQAWPYLWIPFLVEERLLPFTDNVTALRKVVQHQPNLFLGRDCLRQTLAQNNLQHETAHVIAHLILNTSEFKNIYSDLDHELICTSLSEALAVATGVLCATGVELGDQTVNEIYALNGLPTNDRFLKDLKTVERLLGHRRLFELAAVGAAYRALDVPIDKALILDHFIGTQTNKETVHYTQWGLLLGYNSTNFSISTIGNGYLRMHGQADQLASVQRQLSSTSATWYALIDGIERLGNKFFGEDWLPHEDGSCF